MPTHRKDPYRAFNFIVALGPARGDGGEQTIIGGFSDVSGLGMDVPSGRPVGTERPETGRKIRNRHELHEVTLKRGLASEDLRQWLGGVDNGAADPRNLTIVLLDERRSPVMRWSLRNARPKKWTGPTLSAEGGGDVAMEEISLVHEGLEVS
jgi:phage tail-like protein